MQQKSLRNRQEESGLWIAMKWGFIKTNRDDYSLNDFTPRKTGPILIAIGNALSLLNHHH